MDKRILVVDDEMAFLLGIKKVLSRPGYTIDTVETIEEAERLLKVNPYDIVVTDLRLTGVLGEEGLEIIRYVKEFNSDTKCILVTGYGSPEIKEKAYAQGADFYFEKPLSPTVLLDTLKSLETQ